MLGMPQSAPAIRKQILQMARSAAACFCFAVCILILAVWARGPVYSDVIYFNFGKHVVNLQHLKGLPMLFYDLDFEREAEISVTSWVGLENAVGYYPTNHWFGFYFNQSNVVRGTDRSGEPGVKFSARVAAPFWFLGLLSLSLAFLAKPPPKKQFSLRELLMATTLLAVIIGCILSVNRYEPYKRKAATPTADVREVGQHRMTKVCTKILAAT